MSMIETMKARGQIPRAALYARFSSDNQREESIEAQLRALKEHCNKNGILVIKEYVDRAKSATTDDRPQFLQMISDSKEKSYDIILVHKLDRFARNRYDSAYYRRELKNNGVTLISVLEHIDDSPEGIIMEGMLEAMSEYYSKNLSREVRKGMRENALQCISTGGRPPYGFKLNPITRKYEIEEAEALAVKLIFESVCNGIGYIEIMRALNVQGYKTRNDKPFGKNSLYEILRNEKYTGVYIFNKAAGKDCKGNRNNHLAKHDDDIIRIDGGMPQIIDDETFDVVKRILISRKRLSQNNQAVENYLLSGKIYCGECGAAYTGNRKFSGRNKILYVTYRCGAKNLKSSIVCQNKEIRREYIEDFVMKELVQIIFNDSRIPILVEKYKKFHKQSDSESMKKLELMHKNKQNIEINIKNIVIAVANSGSTSLLNALVNYEKELNEIESTIAVEEDRLNICQVSEEEIRTAYTKAKELYSSGSLEEKRQLINLYLEKVVIYKEHIEVFLNTLPTYMIKRNITNTANQRADLGTANIVLDGMKKSHNLVLKDQIVAPVGGGEGNRTPVRNFIIKNVYECIL